MIFLKYADVLDLESVSGHEVDQYGGSQGLPHLITAY